MDAFVTFRRFYLDQCLSEISFSGEVLDAGGERRTTRGAFRPPSQGVSWKFLNIDAQTQPDICASAEAIPLADRTVDFVLLTEVLEHVERPDRALLEGRRVLKAGGRMVITVPFLVPVHGDPHDFTRWTRDGLRSEIERAGLEVLAIRPMGGLIAVVCDLLEAYCQSFYVRKAKPPFIFRGVRKGMRRLAQPHLIRWDRRVGYADYATTGYFVVAQPR